MQRPMAASIYMEGEGVARQRTACGFGCRSTAHMRTPRRGRSNRPLGL